MIDLALTAVALTAVIRALIPLPWALIKPFSCDLCMSFWTGLLVALAAAEAHRVPPAGMHALLAFALERAGAVVGLTFLLNCAVSWLRDTRGSSPLLAPLPTSGLASDEQKS